MLGARVMVGLSLLGCLATAGRARATILEYLDTPALARSATAIVRGKVVRQRVVVVDGRPWTDSVVRVATPLKGRARRGELVTVRQPGGETATLGMHVAGAARFSDGEEVLLFLAADGPRFVPVGMALGKFEVYRDRGGVERVRRDLRGVAFARFDGHGKVQLQEPLQLVRSADLTVSEFLAAIPRRDLAGGAP
ncbi:MAG: hypothetical protein IT371_19015 [Deltaproteobacteria bacterium]|nr:hypothetical protein [Deltaproteobacteria bacterium]